LKNDIATAELEKLWRARKMLFEYVERRGRPKGSTRVVIDEDLPARVEAAILECLRPNRDGDIGRKRIARKLGLSESDLKLKLKALKRRFKDIRSSLLKRLN
jgi:hypothetical protein